MKSRGLFMKIKLVAISIFLVGFLFSSAPMFAHHGSAGYETGPDKMLQLKGTVTKFVYGFPHSLVYFDSTNDAGNTKNWILEAPPPTLILEGGPWTKRTLNPGDVVTLYFHPCKNDKGCGILRKAVLPNGQIIAAWRQYVDSTTLQPHKLAKSE
jgi:Family of unknown function (DUF6152)